MKPEHLHILQHALGLDRFGQGTHYRNRYTLSQLSDGFGDCQEMVAAGLMVCRDTRQLTGGMYTFQVTDAGKAAVKQHSPAPPKLSRGKRRYREFLSWSSATGGTFREFLTLPK